MVKKRKSLSLGGEEKQKEFVQTVLQRYDDDLQDRADWSQARLQRYAKLYGWLEPKSYPWANASNQHVPMLMTNTLRTEDTLHNAVLMSRPIMSGVAINKADAPKGKQIDELLDYQLFVEQGGEDKIAQLINSYVVDGRFIAFVPWVKEKRKARTLKPVSIPDGMEPRMAYDAFITALFPKGVSVPTSENKYKVTIIESLEDEDPEEVLIEFFEEDDQHFALVTQEKVIFDGPCPIPKPLEDVILPARSENPQPPSPSNPMGAKHVIMVDTPSWDEVKRLQASGYYDLLTDDQIKDMEGRTESEVGNNQSGDLDSQIEDQKIQKDALAGQVYGNAKSSAQDFTRLTVFIKWDIEGQPFQEEVVARILFNPDRSNSVLCRLRYLEEEYPREDLSRPRPFAYSPAFIPIQGQWLSMGLLELLEHMQDLTKILLDQMIDKHTLSNMPYGFYRAASGLRPEVMRAEPGALIPTSNPQQDIFYPQMPLQDQTIALNLIALVQQWSERQSMQGSLQMGGVPQGKASALRTSTNMMAVLQQGDARPEHILRRFFQGLAEIYQQMHELNKVFLPKNKQYSVSGFPAAGNDPYRMVKGPEDLSGLFRFNFKANSLNTSQGLKSQILTELVPMLVNGLTMQLGITDKETVYNLLYDLIESKGQDTNNRYIKAPPGAGTPKITASQAMQQMLLGEIPKAPPAEGAQGHLAALEEFQKDPAFIQIVQSDPNFGVLYQAYMQQVQMAVQQEMIQAQQAQMFAGAMGGGGATGGPQGQVDPSAQQMGPAQPGAVQDQSLPSAKGSV